MAAVSLWWWSATVFSLQLYSVSGEVISIHPIGECVTSNSTEGGSTNQCMSLDTALSSLTEDATLRLSHGTYMLTTFTILSDASNVSIIGDPASPSLVVISCADEVGFFFFNMSQLSISGLTIEHCGVSGNNSDIAFRMINDVIELHYLPLPDISVALLLVNLPDFHLDNAIVRDTRGFGVLGINLVGNVSFYQVHIVGNYPSKCVLDKNDLNKIGGGGGGAFFLYQDYVETMVDEDNHHELVESSLKTEFNMIESDISDNYVCRLDPFNILHESIERGVQESIPYGLSVVGAGGLSLVLMQSSYQFTGVLDSCIFHNNSGTYDGEAMQITIHEIVNNSRVDVLNSIFHHNGEHLYKEHGVHGLGLAGALLIRYYFSIPVDLHEDDNHHDEEEDFTSQLASQLPCGVTISNCNFYNNSAKNGGAISVFSFRPKVQNIRDWLIIKNSLFLYNQADFGGAIYMTDLNYNAFVQGLKVSLHSINATRNLKRDLSISSSLQATSGIIDINFLTVTFSGDNYISSNLDTGMILYGAILEISGSALLEKNIGSNGGALSLNAESYMVILDPVNYTFLENTAAIAGGGVYVNLKTARSVSYDCFFFFRKIDFFCHYFNTCGPPILGTFKFINNTAPLGSAMYGPAFIDCPWAQPWLKIYGTNTEAIYLFLSSLNIDLTKNTSNVVNTVAHYITDSEANREISAMPGVPFVIDLGAFDKLNQKVPLTVFSRVNNDDADLFQNPLSSELAHSSIGDTNRYLLDSEEENYTKVPVILYGSENTTYNISIITNEAPVEYVITVSLSSCFIGFRYNYTTQNCDCEISLFYRDIYCSSNGTIVFGGPWVGLVDGKYARARCVTDYCNSTVLSGNLDDPNLQCSFNRSGILCGRCKKELSRVLGSYDCERCTNYFLVLVVVFAILGLVLVVIIAVFNITITTGYINGMIFYSNVMTIYLSSPSPAFNASFFQVPVILLNLQLGIKTCLYDGMNDIDAALLSFIFPVYLLLILVLITVFVKLVHNKHLVKFLNTINITHVFATLILLSLTSIMRSCIDALNFTDINVEGEINRRWWIDPSQDYFESSHIALVFIAIIFLLVFPLPLLIVLLFPQFFLRYSRLKPLLDAFIAPLRQESLFWVGLRIACRIFFLLLSLLEDKYLFPILSLFIAFLAVLEAYIKPFKNTLQNLVDLSIMLNLTLMSILAIASLSTPKSRELNIAVQVFLTIFIVEVICIVIYHVITAIPKVKVFMDNQQFKTKAMEMMKFGTGSSTESRGRVFSKHGTTKRVPMNMASTHTSLRMYPVLGEDGDFQPASFVGFRESMFESRVDSSTVYTETVESEGY